MLLSLALIFMLSLITGWLCTKVSLPSLVGMLLTGIILGPYALDLIDSSILDISAYLRHIALIIILVRAGLNLDFSELKKVGRPAIMMCFVPALFEICGMVLFAPKLLGISLIESAVMGAVVAAVSPAVVVPRMLRMIDEMAGTDKGIPQLIMAGASVDDVFVIVLFTTFADIAAGDGFSPSLLLRIPTSVVFGIAGGLIIGLVMSEFFKRVHIRDSIKVLIIFSIAFILVTIDDKLSGAVGFSGLIAIMSMCAQYRNCRTEAAMRLSGKFSRLWIAAEMLLFVLVGAAVDIGYAADYGLKAVLVIVCALLFRMAGVAVCVSKTKLNRKERLFCMIAYCPKATVQAAIGSVPLSMGLSCGNIVLTAAVLAILITAPLGAFAIDISYKKLLRINNDAEAG